MTSRGTFGVQTLKIGHIDYTGTESTVSFTPTTFQHIDLGYTFIHAKHLKPGSIGVRLQFRSA